MAAGDQGAAPERKGLPLWVIIAAGGGLALFLYLRNRNATATTQPPLVPAVTTDPNTGLPIDPLTGLPFQGTSTQPKTLTDWIGSAEAWASGHNLNPALVSKALYDYTNGNRLSEAEAGILQKILTGVGYPPIVLPWNGPTLSNPSKPNGTPSPVSLTAAQWKKLTAAQQKLWEEITTRRGAHVFIPTGSTLPAGSRAGAH